MVRKRLIKYSSYSQVGAVGDTKVRFFVVS
jgi:hypothetical protein